MESRVDTAETRALDKQPCQVCEGREVHLATCRLDDIDADFPSPVLDSERVAPKEKEAPSGIELHEFSPDESGVCTICHKLKLWPYHIEPQTEVASPESERVKRHAFVYGGNAEGKCGFAWGGTVCGQPKDAECHKVEAQIYAPEPPRHSANCPNNKIYGHSDVPCSADCLARAYRQPPDRIYVPLPYAGICSIVDRPDLPQAVYVHSDLASGPAITVEDVLAELREMFPDLQIIVSVRDCGEETLTVRGKAIEYSIQVGMNGHDFDADTLAESLQAVRDWKEKQ
jgi:hypothetical protein